MLVNLVDGGIKKFETDSNFYPGHCSTCDFGSEYISRIDIELTSFKIEVEVDKSYDYPLSEQWLMMTILPNYENIKEMTERQFSNWLKGKLEEELWQLSDREYCVC